MRYAAFLLLLLLSAYFLIIKPYLIHRGISYHVGGVSLTLHPLTLRVGEAYILLPRGEGLFFLSLRNLTLAFRDRLSISLDEGYLLSTGAREGGKRRIPPLTIPPFLRDLNLRVSRFLFIGGSQGEILLLSTLSPS